MFAVVVSFATSLALPAFAGAQEKRAEIQEILKLTGSFAGTF